MRFVKKTRSGYMKAGMIAGVAIGRTLEVLRSVLREIFDESAYARFLERQAVPSSRQAYADFLHEGDAGRERRPRCC
jgi:hypothetical protein